MGKMVVDTRAAVHAVAELDTVDPSRIYIAGYSLGAKVGLLTAALEPRVRAVAAIAGFDELRLQSAGKGTEGLRHYSHLHGLMPRLGFFEGHEERLPFDFEEVLALAAPKPVLVVAPLLDRYAPVADVRRGVEAARKAYAESGKPGVLLLDTPLEFNRFTRPMQERVFDWLAEQ
jgi:dipeptidyl aminopeptidase/acylaminoacyl peptidase